MALAWGPGWQFQWYFPENPRLDQHGKYLLLALSRDRSALIGFRCVVDSADPAPQLGPVF